MSEEINILAELESLTDDKAAPDVKPVKGEEALAPVVEDAEEPEKVEATDEVVEEPEAEKPEPEVEAEEEEEPQPEVDPKTARALEIRQKEEKRQKAQHAQRMAELRAFENELAQRERALTSRESSLDNLKKAGKADPVRFVREFLELSPEDYEYVSQQFYYLSKKADESPKLRMAAESQRRQRENDDRLNTAMKELNELKQSIAQRDMEAQKQKVINEYLDGVTKAVSDDYLIVKQWLTKAPNKARQRMLAVADRLADENGYIPDHTEVLEALETERRQELEELGVSVETLKTKQKQPDPVVAEKTKRRPTLSGDMGIPKASKPVPKTREEEIEDVRLALERGALD